MPTAALNLRDEARDACIAYAHDPYRWVMWAFPWGKEGTSLERELGPRTWQREAMQEIGRQLREQRLRNSWEAIQYAIASGHDIGKSALVAWLVLWAMHTCDDTRGVVTANTDGQLRTKTWPEVAKWHGLLAFTKDWFTLTKTAIYSNEPGHDLNWRVDIIPWSVENTEAFAGLHNKGKRIIVIFDESSAIHDKIWEVAEGALLDDETEIIWFCAGNPTRNTGRFKECFGRLRHRWTTRQIDSRTVEGTNKEQIRKLVEDEGEDSDVVRYRVKGEFPLQADYQLISQALVAAARRRDMAFDRHQPLVAGLDFARSGACETVLSFRCGRDAKSLKWAHWRERDSAVLAGRVAQVLFDMRARGWNVHTVFADGGGLGGPICDILRQSGWPIREVLFGAAAADNVKYGNKGSEMWARMRDWMEGGAIPDLPILEEQLVTRDYKFHIKTQQLVLLPKDSLEQDGLFFDWSDSLALTFAEHVLPEENIAVASHDADKCLVDL